MIQTCLKAVLFGFVLLLISVHGVAQSYEQGVAYNMDKIYGQLEEDIIDFPAGIRRIAIYKVNYSALRFTEQEIDLIRNKLETAFREYGGLTVLSPLELEPNDKMKIMGTDSSLQILNIHGRSIADLSPELLTTITQRYGVQGLVELSVQRVNPEGLILNIRLMNPNSREIAWTKTLIANPFRVKEKIDLGQPFVLQFGAGGTHGESVIASDTAMTGLNAVVVSFSAHASYRQTLNRDNSAYIGLGGGINVLRSSSENSFNAMLVELGITYYQAISQKNEMINDYRTVFFANSNIQFSPLGIKGQIFSVKSGMMFNLSRNLGLQPYLNVIISGETLTLENDTEITYNQIGYGLHAVVRF